MCIKQDRETILLAVELIDRYYLQLSRELSLEDFQMKLLNTKLAIEFQITCLLLASKLHEVDDNAIILPLLLKFVTD